MYVIQIQIHTKCLSIHPQRRALISEVRWHPAARTNAGESARSQCSRTSEEQACVSADARGDPDAQERSRRGEQPTERGVAAGVPSGARCDRRLTIARQERGRRATLRAAPVLSN
jgi:hypothetical protein